MKCLYIRCYFAMLFCKTKTVKNEKNLFPFSHFFALKCGWSSTWVHMLLLSPYNERYITLYVPPDSVTRADYWVLNRKHLSVTGLSRSSPLLVMLYSMPSQTVYYSSRQDLYISFYSDRSVTSSGFKLAFQAVPASG